MAAMTAVGTKRPFHACRRMSVLGGRTIVQTEMGPQPPTTKRAPGRGTARPFASIPRKPKERESARGEWISPKNRAPASAAAARPLGSTYSRNSSDGRRRAVRISTFGEISTMVEFAAKAKIGPR